MGAGAIKLKVFYVAAVAIALGEGDRYEPIRQDSECAGQAFGHPALHCGGAVR